MQKPGERRAAVVSDEDGRAIAAWGDEGGQGGGQGSAGQQVADTPPAGAQGATAASRNLPPLLATIWPTQHQFGALVLPWSWCRCCQRAFLKGTFRSHRIAGSAPGRRLRTVQQCPYLDCWGQIQRDSRPWASIRQAHPSYPERPERSVVYPHQPGRP